MSSGPFTVFLVVPRCVLVLSSPDKQPLQSICNYHGLGQAGEVWRCSDIPTEHDLEVLLWVPSTKKMRSVDENMRSMDENMWSGSCLQNECEVMSVSSLSVGFPKRFEKRSDSCPANIEKPTSRLRLHQIFARLF